MATQQRELEEEDVHLFNTPVTLTLQVSNSRRNTVLLLIELHLCLEQLSHLLCFLAGFVTVYNFVFSTAKFAH